MGPFGNVPRLGQAPLAAMAALFVLALGCLFFGYMAASMPPQFPLIAVVGVFVFVVAFFRMDVALVFLIIAMLFSPQVNLASLPKRALAIRIEDVLIVVLGVAWLARAAVQKGAEIIPRTALNRLIGFYCVSFLVSTMSAIVTSGINPVKALFYMLKYFEYFVLFFLTASTVKRTKTIYIYVTFLLVTFFCVNLYAASEIGHVERVSAPFEGAEGEPNTLGGYQLLMLCVTLGLFCHLRSLLPSVILAVLALSTLLPFLHTLSRASYLGLGPAVIALLVYNRSPRRNALFMVILLAVIAGAFFMPPKVFDRIAYTFRPQYQQTIKTAEIFGVKLDPSSSARWQDAQEAIAYWRKKPFFGYGLTGLSFLDGQYVNNLVELGVIGFVLFALMIWVLQREVLRIYRATEDPVIKGVALGFAAGNIGLLVHALTANTFILIRVMEPYWFTAALLMIYPRLGEMPSPATVQEKRWFGRRNIDMITAPPGQAGRIDAT